MRRLKQLSSSVAELLAFFLLMYFMEIISIKSLMHKWFMDTKHYFKTKLKWKELEEKLSHFKISQLEVFVFTLN